MKSYRVTVNANEPIIVEAESVDEAIIVAQASLGIQQMSGDIDFVEVEINPKDL